MGIVLAGKASDVSFKVLPLLGWLLAVPKNIILGWKGLPGTNTLLAHLATSSVTKQKIKVFFT